MTTIEIMEFLQEYMLTKEESKNFATKKDLRQTEQRILDHVDDRICDLEGSVILRQRKQDHKVDQTLDLLDRHAVVPKTEVDTVRSISVFPSSL